MEMFLLTYLLTYLLISRLCPDSTDYRERHPPSRVQWAAETHRCLIPPQSAKEFIHTCTVGQSSCIWPCIMHYSATNNKKSSHIVEITKFIMLTPHYGRSSVQTWWSTVIWGDRENGENERGSENVWPMIGFDEHTSSSATNIEHGRFRHASVSLFLSRSIPFVHSLCSGHVSAVNQRTDRKAVAD